MNKKVLSFMLNGKPFSCYTDIGASLSDLLQNKPCRDFTQGCNTVLVDGIAVNSDNFIAMAVEGCEVFTFDGLYESEDMKNLISALRFDNTRPNCRCFADLLMMSIPLLCSKTAPSRSDFANTFSGTLCHEIKMSHVIDTIEKAYNDNMFKYIEKKSVEETQRFETLDPKQVQKMTIMLPEAIGVDIMEMPIKIASSPISDITRNTITQDIEVKPVTTPSAPVESIESQELPLKESTSPIEAIETPPVDMQKEPEEILEKFESSTIEEKEQPDAQELKEETEEAITAPASIFDEGFMDSIEKGEIPKPDSKPKEKPGFFSKFTAAFKDKHHKTLELPDIDEE